MLVLPRVFSILAAVSRNVSSLKDRWKDKNIKTEPLLIPQTNLIIGEGGDQSLAVQVKVDVYQVREKPLGVPAVLLRVLHFQVPDGEGEDGQVRMTK